MRTAPTYHGSCPYCGKGTVQPTVFQNFQTKVLGFPFTVPQATVGVCDHCGERMFNGKELARWEELFMESVRQQEALLSAAEIRDLRESLDLTQVNFARLIGVSRRSIVEWEKDSRQKDQGRNADLVMKLLRASLGNGPVDVLDLLLEELEKWGLRLQVRRPTAV